MEVLLGFSLAFIGILAGIYIATLIHDHRIADLSAAQYVAMHRMRDKTFRRVMPVLGLTTVGLIVASTALVLAPGMPRLLGAAASLLLLIDLALTVTRQLPLNQQIQGWTETTIPGDWRRVRDLWAFHHNARTILGSASYIFFLAAVLLTIAR
jgi:Domain of unknown function (DUF1772)